MCIFAKDAIYGRALVFCLGGRKFALHPGLQLTEFVRRPIGQLLYYLLDPCGHVRCLQFSSSEIKLRTCSVSAPLSFRDSRDVSIGLRMRKVTSPERTTPAPYGSSLRVPMSTS